MKKIIYIVLFSILPMLTYAQLDVVAPGDVGIGTTTPTTKLDVVGNAKVRGNFLDVGQDAGTTAAYLRIGRNRTANGTATVDFFNTPGNDYGFRFGRTGAGASLMFHQGTSPFILQNTEAAPIYMKTANAHRLAILADGRVGIGTTGPAAGYQLHVKGSIAFEGTSQNVSDKRLKTNERDFEYGLKDVLTLSPIYYNYNGKAGTNTELTHVGIYAQDLKKVAPELVSEFTYEETEVEINSHNGEIEVQQKVKNTPENYLSINESSIKYMLINAVKEQQEIITTLEERINKMEALLNSDTESPRTSQTVELGMLGQLLQNQPNPFNETTTIKYTLPQLGAGTYVYTLIVDGQVVDTKKMVLTK